MTIPMYRKAFEKDCFDRIATKVCAVSANSLSKHTLREDVDNTTNKVYNTEVDNSTSFYQEAFYVESIYAVFSGDCRN